MENQQFIESIKLLNGDVYHLAYHQERVCRTFSHFFPSEKVLSLQESINKIALPAIGKYKIRIVYSKERLLLRLYSKITANTHLLTGI